VTAPVLSLSDLVAAASLLVAVIALIVAVIALGKADRNASAATMVTLNEAFRQAWPRFLSAEGEEAKQYEFSELMNLLEIGCAVYWERSLSGVSRELIEEYLGNVLSLLGSNSDARGRIEQMRHSPTTFKYIRKFLLHMARSGDPHAIASLFSSAQAQR
jgi:hypothetical protein